MCFKSNRRITALFLLIISCALVMSGCKSKMKKITTFIHNKQTEEIEEELDFDPFKRLNVDLLNADVVIRYGSKYSAKVKRQKRYKLDCRVEKNTLTIRDAKVDQKGEADIEITLPLESELQVVNVSSMAGSITLKRLSAKKVDLYCGVGDIELHKCDIKNVAANADVSTIRFAKMKHIKETGLNLSTEEGNVYFKDNSRGNAYGRKGRKRFIASHVETGDIYIE